MNFLITGGASGLGYAITRAVASAYPEAKIYFTYYSSDNKAQQLQAISANNIGIKCDFKNNEDILSLCRLIDTSEIDVLINNALTSLQKKYFYKTPTVDFNESFVTDVVPVLEITKAFLIRARQKKFGKIITILSAGLLNKPAIGWSVYLANKAYLQAMHRSWATENIAFNITSNCVSPDFMLTPLQAGVDERVIENMITDHPLKKLLTVEEVAQTVLFICNSSQQLNGQNIILNAGQNL